MKIKLLLSTLCACVSLYGSAQSHRVAQPIVMADFQTIDTAQQGSLSWFYPDRSPLQALQFEKVELGIKLPPSIQEKIKLFLNGSETGDNAINPFDRNDIDIDALFYVNGEQVKRNEGFYFEEYRRDLGNNQWRKDTTSYTFRIRHAPEFVGEYTVEVSIVIKGREPMSVKSNFTVSPSENKGFLEPGSHYKHMRFSKTKESFVGIGQEIPWVMYDDWFHTDVAAGPVNFMVMYNTFRKFQQNGGNFTRMVAAPWFMQLEWEALGNYQPKMGQAWEFDRMNDKLQEYQIYYIFCGLLHSPLECRPNELGMTPGVSWESYCYNKNDRTPAEVASGEPVNCVNPIDFYSDSMALVHQQNYFRYLVARWGYSTSLAGWQLMSEADQTCEYGDKVAEDGTIIDHSEDRRKVNEWTGAITRFMRTECDDKHLKSISFIKGKNYSSYLWDPTIFEHEDVDFFGLHEYVFETDPPAQRIRNRNLVTRYESVTNLNVGIIDGVVSNPKMQERMYIFDEFGHVLGIPRAIPEDQHDDAIVEFNGCVDFMFKQDLWFTFSSGCAVAGLDWWLEHDKRRHDMWKRYFNGMKLFTDNIDFENVNYTTVRQYKEETYIAQRWPIRRKDIERSNESTYRKSDKLEAYIQLDSLGTQGFGWMLNRSFHWGNLVDSMPCLGVLARGEEPFAIPYLTRFIDEDADEKPIIIEEDDAFIRVYNVAPKTTFTIDFYDTETGELLRTITERSSNSGALKIYSPAMNPSERYDIAFKFYDSDLGWK